MEEFMLRGAIVLIVVFTILTTLHVFGVIG